MRKLTLSLAVMAALLPVRGYPLGLGDLELSSALNQELNAEIAVLSAASEDAEQIIVKLADRDAFSRAGLDRPHLLQQLKFKIIDKNGSPYVKVYTKTPIREPFLSFLVEIDWPQGHLLREYTLLLDPPVYNTSGLTNPASTDVNSPFNEPADAQAQTQSVYSEQQRAATVQGSAQATSGMQTDVITSDSGKSVNYQYQSLPGANSSADQYRVQQNDTLWSMANRMRPDSSVSVEQMMLALVRKNPEAFIQENINGVKRGYILRIPNRDEATQLDRQQAVAQAREHAALWREYSQGAVSATPASSMEADAFTGESAADQVRDADGHLSIVGASKQGSEQAGSNQDPNAQLSSLKQDLAMAREQLESAELEKEDLRSRLAELEQRVQRVIEMDDGELAKLQQDLQSSQQAAEESAVESTEDMSVEETLSEEALLDDADEMNPQALTDEVLVDEIVDDTPAEDVIFADEAISDEMSEAETPVVMAEPVQEIETPAFAQQKPKNFLDSLMDDPKLLGIIGGGLAFVFLLIALLLKRIRGNKAEEEDEWASAMDSPTDVSNLDDELDAELDDATIKSEAVDMNSTAEMLAMPVDGGLGLDDTQTDLTGDESLEDTVFDLADAEPAAEEDERDDVIAEADVYLAYGIYQQAEDLLNNAIDENPERDDYRMKLLETHYAAKNSAGFEQLAESVKTRKGDDKPYWDRVIAMGMELCPASALFSGPDVIMGDFDAQALLPDKPQTTDLELDAGDAAADDFDLGLDDVELGELDDDSDKTQVISESAELDEIVSAEDELDLASDLESITDEVEELDGSSLEDDTSSDLEFDLGELGDLDDSLDIEDSTKELAESADMEIDDDFSLDFDAADLGFEESESESIDADEISLDADLDSDLGEIEIDGEELALDDMDLGDIDLGDTGLADSAEVDLGVMDLDASDMEMSDDLSVGDSDFDISELSEDVDEVGTKLDLAKAYIDMGDNDGARSILEEVKTEGNDEQQQQAEELLQKAS